jgi:WbqC-like protein family
MGKKVAIVQSSYIPWKGYFDLIRKVDEFIFYDDAQFTKRDWRSRNRIKTSNGPMWLSIPVSVKGKYLQSIKDTEISDGSWNQRHWKSIRASYAHAPYYRPLKDMIEEWFLACTSRSLSEINRRLVAEVCRFLSIPTRLSLSMDYQLPDGKTERLVAMCLQAGADEYVSGPAARSYIDPSLFDRAGIRLTYIAYAGYPEYAQLYPPFDHQVSIIDMILHTGADAVAYMLPL